MDNYSPSPLIKVWNLQEMVKNPERKQEIFASETLLFLWKEINV